MNSQATKPLRRPGRVAAWTLMSAVVWLAIMGGGIVPGSMLAAAGAMVLVWLALTSDPSGTVGPRVVALEWAGVAFLLFLTFTTLPIPPGAGMIQGGLRRAQNLEAWRLFEQAAALDLISTPVRWFALSRNVGGTLRIMVTTVCVLSAAMLVARMDLRERRFLLRFLVFIGALIGGAGYLGQTLAPQGHTLWWVLPIPVSQPGPVACFANRNHFAGFMALLAVPSILLWVDDMVARRRLHAVVMFAALWVMVSALIITQSRGGVLAFVCGLLGVGSWLLYRALCPGIGTRAGRRQRIGSAIFIPVIGFLLTAAVVWRAPPAARARLGEGIRQPFTALSAQTRFEAWHDTYRIWRHYPLFGAGANALRSVYPLHRLGSRRESRTHASNQYLQLLAETGIVGIFLASFWAWSWLRALGTGREREPTGGASRAAAISDVNLCAGVTLGAVTVAAAHGMVDFPHHIPLYAVALASLAAFGLPVPANLKGHHTLPSGARGCAIVCLVIVLMVAPAWRRMHRGDNPNALPQASISELMHYIAWAPTSWQAWFEFGRRCFLAQTWDAARLGERAISRAGQLDPNNYLLWYEVGKLRMQMNDRDGAQQAFERVRELRAWVPIPDLDRAQESP